MRALALALAAVCGCGSPETCPPMPPNMIACSDESLECHYVGSRGDGIVCDCVDWFGNGRLLWNCLPLSCFAPDGQCTGTCCGIGFEYDKCCDGNGHWQYRWGSEPPPDMSLALECRELHECEQTCTDAKCVSSCRGQASGRAVELDDVLDACITQSCANAAGDAGAPCGVDWETSANDAACAACVAEVQAPTDNGASGDGGACPRCGLCAPALTACILDAP